MIGSRDSERLGASAPVFVGRESELRDARAALVDACDGHGAALFVAGEAGVGKTQFAEEVASLARVRGPAILWGRCWEEGGAPAYWPWIQILRSLGSTLDRANLPPDVNDALDVVAGLVPALRRGDGARMPWTPPDTNAARFYLFEAIVRVLVHASERRLTVIVLDDIHAADVPSLRLLEFLTGSVAESRLLVLACYREPEMRASPERARIVDAAARGARRLLLSGLDEPDVARWMAARFGEWPRSELARAVHRKTEGHPFYVESVLLLLAAEGKARSSSARDLQLPEEAYALVDRRLEALGVDGCRTLAVAALVGAEFDAALLETSVPLPEGRLESLLDDAVRAAVLGPDPVVAGRYRFAHALIRERLASRLSDDRRRSLHVELADAMEELHASVAGSVEAALAHHRLEALPRGDARKAARDATIAGDRALAQLGYEQAAVLFEGALRALALDPEGGDRQRAELLLRLGEARTKSGDAAGAGEALAESAALARRLGDAELLGRSSVGFLRWESVVADANRIRLLEEARTALGEEDRPLTVLVLSRLAVALRSSTEWDRCEALSARALAMARRLGEPVPLAAALQSRHTAVWGPEGLDERRALASELLELGEATGDAESVGFGHIWRAAALLEGGAGRDYRTELEWFGALAAKLRQPFYLWVDAFARAGLAILEGRFADAERAIEDERRAGTRLALADVGIIDWVQTFLVRREQGRARELDPDVVSAGYPRVLWRGMIGLLHLELGNVDEAREDLEADAEHDWESVPRDAHWLRGMTFLAELAYRLGDGDRAASLHAKLLPYRGRAVVLASVNACTGSVERFLGLTALACRRVDEAIDHLHRAVEANRALGAPPWVAHSLAELAAAALARGKTSDAAAASAAAAEARAMARSLGMTALLERLSRLGRDGRDVRFEAREAAEPRFVRGGGDWEVSFAGRTVRVTDARGVEHLARVVGEPGRGFRALDLIRPGEEPSLEDVGPARLRLRELREDLEAALEDHDAGRAERLRSEIDGATAGLVRTLGLDGRSRSTVLAEERARKSVTNGIRRAIARLRDLHPELADHLSASVATGATVLYRPPPRR